MLLGRRPTPSEATAPYAASLRTVPASGRRRPLGTQDLSLHSRKRVQPEAVARPGHGAGAAAAAAVIRTGAADSVTTRPGQGVQAAAPERAALPGPVTRRAPGSLQWSAQPPPTHTFL